VEKQNLSFQICNREGEILNPALPNSPHQVSRVRSCFLQSEHSSHLCTEDKGTLPILTTYNTLIKLYDSGHFANRIYCTYWQRSLSKNSGFVILRLDRGIHDLLKRLDSRLRENDELLSETLFLDRLNVPDFILIFLRS
jgi:hypothetical protein